MPEFTFYGTEELMELIQMLPELALDAAQPAMVDTLIFLHGQLPDYPPAIPGSSYKRTGTLGRRFTENTTRGEDAIIGELGTNLAYAPWVVGPDYPGVEIGGRQKYQAQVHVDRWWQFDRVIENSEADVWDEFEEKFWPEFRDRIQQESARLGGDHEKFQ
ncbi:MAG: hypothetical protein ACYC3H_01560 [Bellilinea sp.]